MSANSDMCPSKPSLIDRFCKSAPSRHQLALVHYFTWFYLLETVYCKPTQYNTTRITQCRTGVPWNFSKFTVTCTKRAFDEFKIRWIPPVPLVYPQPAGFFFLGCSLTGKKTADPLASMLADWFFSRLYFSNPLGRKKTSGSDPLVFLHPSCKTQRIHRTHPKSAFAKLKSAGYPRFRLFTPPGFFMKWFFKTPNGKWVRVRR